MMAIDSVTLVQCIDVLEARRQMINAALLDFARPVAACDVDYNTLLAERGALVQALAQLLPLRRGDMKIPHPREDLVQH